MNFREPNTPEEWQEAVDLAEFYLLLDSCEQYGLITGPKINTDRALDILQRGKERGVVPASHEVLIERFLMHG